MGPRKAVNPDPSPWLPLLDSYRLTALPDDTVLEGTPRTDLRAGSPEVVEAIERWPAAAYLDHRDGVAEVVDGAPAGDPGRTRDRSDPGPCSAVF